MSTQHTGDGPPGDKNYYDPVKEEIIRDTGSGRNPNAAAWDPEKMELHQIVNRLLALEERRALPARPVGLGGKSGSTAAAGGAWTAAAAQ